jgi:type II secretory ATPase GspE/PulE/Tfp pilus assembly ATPase PilB-like protein
MDGSFHMNDEQLQQKFIEYCFSPVKAKLNPGKVNKAVSVTKWSDQNIFEAVLELQLMNLEGLQAALSDVTGFESIDPLTEAYLHNFAKSTLATISHKAAIAFRAFPIRIIGGELHMAMANPTDEEVIERLEKMSGYPIKPYVCYSKNILRAVVRYYNLLDDRSFDSLIHDAMDEISGVKKVQPPTSLWSDTLSKALKREIHLFPHAEVEGEEIQEVAVTLLVARIIDRGIQIGASDIHLEPFDDILKIRFRKDGLLFAQWYVPKEIKSYLFNRIKVMAGLDLSSGKRPQDGAISYEKLLPVGVDIRVSIIPAIRGERLVMRLLDKCRGLLTLTNIGMGDDQVATFRKQTQSPYGLILLTGPTGSGKTTTIYSALDQLNTEDRCIITIEDPVEYELKGINQIQVDARQDLTFANAFRAILRQNPDIILLGEIRDSDSATVAINASSTGHLVFSTLHTNDAAHSIPRLIAMGCDPYVLANSLQLIVSQRLVRRLCVECKQPDPLDDARLAGLDIERSVLKKGQYSVPGNCVNCNSVGYLGRIGLFENLVPDYMMREMIIDRAPGLHIHQYAVESGMRTLREDGLLKAQQGYTSLDEILRVTTEEDM